MDRKIKAKALHANVKVSESISVTASTNTSSVFLQEYEKRRAGISPDSTDGDYLVVFLLLQVYVENHFHYYFRFLLWNYQDQTNYPGWNEESYLIRGQRSKLSLFQNYLQNHQLPFDENDFTAVCQAITALNDARNKIAHGHEVSSTSTGGSRTDSPLKQYLNIDALRKSEQDILTIKQAWSRIIATVTADADAVDSSPLVNASLWQHAELKFTIKDEWY